MQYYYKHNNGYGTFYKDTDKEALEHAANIAGLQVLYRDNGNTPHVLLSFLPAYIPELVYSSGQLST